MKLSRALVVAMLGIACHRDEPTPAPSALTASIVARELPADLSIELERTGHFYSPTYTVKVDAAGLVTWDGVSYVNAKGSRSARIPVDSVRDLLARFDALHFVELKDDYSIFSSDCPTTVFTLKLNNHAKKVRLYWAGTPEWGFENVHRDAADKWVSDKGEWVSEINKDLGTFVELEALAKAIDDEAGTAQWIGDAPSKRHR